MAIALADLMREAGLDPVAVSCDSIQVYRGLEVLSGAADAGQQSRLEHRLIGIAEVTDEFSAGQYEAAAHPEIDGLLANGRSPILVGGTGLYLRAALSDLELRQPVDPEIRLQVESEIDDRGSAAVHATLPTEIAATVHPNDRKRVARSLELHRSGVEPSSGTENLWTARLRHPGALIGLTIDRDALASRISDRVDAMAAAGAGDEARRAESGGASRTARAALGFEGFAGGNLDGVKTAHRRYARRQLTWMRRMENVDLVDRTNLSDQAVAERIVEIAARVDPG